MIIWDWSRRSKTYQDLINEEIALMKKEGSNSYILSDGVFVNQEGKKLHLPIQNRI